MRMILIFESIIPDFRKFVKLEIGSNEIQRIPSFFGNSHGIIAVDDPTKPKERGDGNDSEPNCFRCLLPESSSKTNRNDPRVVYPSTGPWDDSPFKQEETG